MSGVVRQCGVVLVLSLLVGSWAVAGCTFSSKGTGETGVGGSNTTSSMGGTPNVGGGGAGGAPSTCVAKACPGEDAACRFRACEADECTMANALSDTACNDDGGRVCDGEGFCVACNRDAHCGEQERCIQHECVPLQCGNSEKDGTETDIDCGGKECPDCGLAKACAKFNDCETRFCNEGVCTECTILADCMPSDYCDALTNQCAVKLGNGASCTYSEQCGSAKCVDGVCCNNLCEGECETCALGGKEGTCTPFLDGMDPEMECGADKCNGLGSCRCKDGVKNGIETDIDCGGGVCEPCVDFLACNDSIDCISQVCTGMICQVPKCDDTIMNGDETDVDCGGAVCDACQVGEACQVGSDCSSLVCTANVCQAPTCNDVVKNQDETDVDCGGANCPACADGSACVLDGDCQSTMCLGGSCFGECVDNVKNGAETDIDCGGNVCVKCVDGKGCLSSTDCVNGICLSNVCASPSCNDMVKNQDETDVDCGGTICNDCAVGQACLLGSDCTTGVCAGNVCQAPTCSDSVKNQDETDVDCGGSVCAGCGPAKACALQSDCLSESCDANNLCECSLVLNVQADGSSGGQGLAKLILSEISPGNHIEVYNTTNNAIDLAMKTYEFCSPFNYASLANLAMGNLSTVVPAKGFYVLSWPAGFTDTTQGGEVILFETNDFNDNTKIMDFVCWGNNPHNSRLGQAQLIGKWNLNSNCVGGAVMQSGALHRKATTTGLAEADYDFVSTPTGMTCAAKP